jgi:hypothetical protein
MALPLPNKITEPPDAADIQGNFDEIGKQFPLGRRHIKLETPNVVGDSGQPAFKNSWVNFDTATYTGARFWRDAMDMIHIEGVVKSGTVGAAGVIFTLPDKYRPSKGHYFATYTNTGVGRITIAPTGDVIAEAGGNGSFSINCNFKQEA